MEARTWMPIVCNCISSCGKISNIPMFQAQKVACFLYYIPLNIGLLIINEFQEFKMHNSLSLHVPSLITQFCKWVVVEVLPSDNWIEPKNMIFHLKCVLPNLEKPYARLSKSHGELSISLSRMKKQEKSRDKFFTQMWKCVKGLYKVLKANEELPTSRPHKDEDTP
ncbi:hypothetical protein H5410_057099, partial [Solanum commersonii]